MRVLGIVADGSLGGGTTHVLQILKGLSGCISFELVSQSGSYLLREAQNLGIPCHGVNFFRSRLNPLIPIALRRICLNTQPQVVHVHGGRAGFFCAMAHIDAPALYTVHGFHFLQKPWVLRRLALLAERYVFQHVSRIVFVSQYDTALGRSLGLLESTKPYELIYNGIASRDVALPVPLDVQHLGFIARLEQQKDPLLFLDALENLPECSATIVGDGSLAILVKQEIHRRGLGHRVRILGALSHLAALQILSELSVLILSSRWEGLPLIVLEAMSMGVPVVSMNVSGMNEMIEDGIDGVLVAQRTGERLAHGVRRVTQNFSLRARIIQNARLKVTTKFSEDHMLQALHRMYQEIQ